MSQHRIMALLATMAFVLATATAALSANGNPAPPKTNPAQSTTTATSTTPAPPAAPKNSKPQSPSQNGKAPNEPLPGRTAPNAASNSGIPKNTWARLQLSSTVKDGSWCSFTLTIVGGQHANHKMVSVGFVYSNAAYDSVRWPNPDEIDIWNPSAGQRSFADPAKNWLNIGVVTPGKKIVVQGYIWAPARKVVNGQFDRYFYMKAALSSLTDLSWTPSYGAKAPYVVSG